MSDSNARQQILWLRDLPQRPLCDVPWMGNTVVLANGDVNFCCFSDAVVGNVNRAPLGQIWNGDTMRRIRRGLRDQTLPPECRSPSCPIFRGDENHVLLMRMDGAYREQNVGAADPLSAIRAGFDGSGLCTSGPTAPSDGPAVELELRYDGSPVRADLYLAVRGEEGVTLFLPRLEAIPIPYRAGMRLPSDGPVSVRWRSGAPGRYAVCAAVFESGSHPNIASNCYWSATIFVEAQTGVSSIARGSAG
jgi:hypothetical protein